MNVPLTDSTGLNIYRELMHREERSAASWYSNCERASSNTNEVWSRFCAAWLTCLCLLQMDQRHFTRSPTRRSCSTWANLQNIPAFPCRWMFRCVEPPMCVLHSCCILSEFRCCSCWQLRELQKERATQAVKTRSFERVTFPKETDIPVSEMSVGVWGEDAWHSQKPPTKNPGGAPATYKPFEPPYTRWSKKKWDVDKMQYVREGLGPAHVNSRLAKEGPLDATA